MIAYLDSSVLLRIILGQRNAVKEWRAIERGVASALVEVECLRTLDRLRVSERLSDEAIALRREAVFRLLESMEIIDLTRPILTRAAQPFSTALGILDAIHLATALVWREGKQEGLVMATHDTALAVAARASGFRVVGTP